MLPSVQVIQEKEREREKQNESKTDAIVILYPNIGSVILLFLPYSIH